MGDDLLAKLGRKAEASKEFQHAASLTRNARDRKLLLMRALACSGSPLPSEGQHGPR
ncbi:hypothetical protein [Variovorax sp. PBL-H6]|uniref:hypothetical protein n=1 Tax=Variovorax sp. PBL-H6 TaxID=434009 RepID=UPI0018D8F219|nr:hypothetical protein [Variovorax sp. PBL-H6]